MSHINQDIRFLLVGKSINMCLVNDQDSGCGRAMSLGNLQRQRILLVWDNSRVRAYCACTSQRVRLGCFSLLLSIFLLWESARYRLIYRLKEP